MNVFPAGLSRVDTPTIEPSSTCQTSGLPSQSFSVLPSKIRTNPVWSSKLIALDSAYGDLAGAEEGEAVCAVCAATGAVCGDIILDVLRPRPRARIKNPVSELFIDTPLRLLCVYPA